MSLQHDIIVKMNEVCNYFKNNYMYLNIENNRCTLTNMRTGVVRTTTVDWSKKIESIISALQ